MTEVGTDAVSIGIEAIDELADKLKVSINNEGPGFGLESSFGYAYREFWKNR